MIRKYGRFPRFILGAISIVIAIEILALFGSQFGLGIPKQVYISNPDIWMSNTALTFLIAGISVALLYLESILKSNQNKKQIHRFTGISSLLVVVLGLLSLSQLGLRRELDVDRILLLDHTSIIFTNSMGTLTTISFILFGIALLALWQSKPWGIWLAQGLSLIVMGIMLIPLADHLLDYDLLLGHDLPYSLVAASIVLHTTLAFMVLGISLLGLYPQRGWMQAITSPLVGGLMARQLLPWMILYPLLMTYLTVYLEGLGWYSDAFGHALWSVAMIPAFSILIWCTARTLNQLDHRRQHAESSLKRLNELLEQRVHERTTELAQVNEHLQHELASRQRHQALLAEQAHLLNLAHDPIITRSLKGEITFWNQGAERMYGWSASEACGQIIHHLLQTKFPQSQAEIDSLFFSQGYWEGELVHCKRDGSTVIVSSRWALQRDGQGFPIKVLEINTDITEQKQAEDQLLRSHERINLANAELARVARLKDEFFANMSHELRTPLNSILGLSEALLEAVFGSLTPQQRRSIETVEQSGQHLLSLINDILDLSKIESGKMELDRSSVSVQSLCESSLNFVRQQASQKQIRIRCQVDQAVTEIKADERRLLQVLVNLLSNAVKFTPDGGQVRLEVNLIPEQQAVEFQIVDTGIGIAPEDMSQLFQPFVQLDSSLARHQPGTGLGLALTRRIIDLHGGSIHVDSAVGEGSCFRVLLPWFPLSEQDDQPLPTIDLSHGAVRHVLVVEDSSVDASQIKRYLTELGATSVVHPIGDGVAAAAIRSQPDVIVLDLLLPDSSGWEVLSQLKANPQTQHIPVIIVSLVDDRSRSLALGAAEHILKPLTRQKFHQALNKAIGGEQMGTLQTSLVVPPVDSVTKTKILLAEDNEANITTMMSYLEAHNFLILLARNGLEAVKMAKQYQPDLILMDIQMPEMDGLEATHLIHADPETSQIPIIALTALAMPGDRERCLSAGATEYLAKPVRMKQLLELMFQYLAPSDGRQAQTKPTAPM